MNDISTNASENSVSNLSSMKTMLFKLFLYYSSFGERTKVDILSHSNFIHLLKDSNIISESFTIESSDVFIRKILKKNKTFAFQEFCDAFIQLSESLYPLEFPTMKVECLVKLLSTHIVPLYTSLLSQNQILNLEISLTPPLLQILKSIKSYLFGLYKLYFP